MKDVSAPIDAFAGVARDSLADTIARRIRAMIQSGEYSEGDRLPAILEMARRFGVGPPTVREALKKLETLGVVDVRHGSGVYVASRRELLVLARPQIGGAVADGLLLDLIDARIALEVQAVEMAAVRASAEAIVAMRHLLGSVEGEGQRTITVPSRRMRRFTGSSPPRQGTPSWSRCSTRCTTCSRARDGSCVGSRSCVMPMLARTARSSMRSSSATRSGRPSGCGHTWRAYARRWWRYPGCSGRPSWRRLACCATLGATVAFQL